jgi:SAM-dependent methyltransferase
MDQSGGYRDCDFVAEFYDHVTPYADVRDIEFYLDLARSNGSNVLEIACGTGRVLIPMARAGVQMTGLDLSESMLAVCRDKLTQEPEDVQARAEIHHGDMRAFDFGRTFDLITIPFRAFQHVEDVDGQIACLECIRRHLRPDGVLAVDVFNPKIESLISEEQRSEYDHEAPYVMPDGRSVARCSRNPGCDLPRQIRQCELIYDVTHPDGREERLVHAFNMRYLFRYELEHLLVRCGFEVEAIYGDYDRRSVDEAYPCELIAVARKPENGKERDQ